MLDLKFNIPFFERGDFPASVTNASSEIILQNPWANSGNSAPFDQCELPVILDLSQDITRHDNSLITPRLYCTAFYLILDVATGGTNGWFPDGDGNKPWLNGELGEKGFQY